MLAGIGAEILGWNGGSDQSDGNNDLGSEPLFGGQKWSIQVSSLRKFREELLSHHWKKGLHM